MAAVAMVTKVQKMLNSLPTSQSFAVMFPKFSRCLPFSKWLPKHGIKMGGKNSTLSDIIKI
jgi:hypothetical protein